ncbi:MAG TPA: GNAT family protein [Roseiarcus sp.]|nr:GNAT family protein [Roseiarcus sp.]
MSDVAIVPIALDHVESYHRAVDVVARERKYLTILEAFPLPQTREFVLGLIKNGDPQFAALADGVVVGWCDIRRLPFPSQAHRGILGMGILPAFRGRGLGRRLLTATLTQASRAGFVRIELDVRADNARAIALYEKAGFVREGVIRDAVCVDGVYCDAILMALVNRENAASSAKSRP